MGARAYPPTPNNLAHMQPQTVMVTPPLQLFLPTETPFLRICCIINIGGADGTFTEGKLEHQLMTSQYCQTIKNLTAANTVSLANTAQQLAGFTPVFYGIAHQMSTSAHRRTRGSHVMVVTKYMILGLHTLQLLQRRMAVVKKKKPVRCTELLLLIQKTELGQLIWAPIPVALSKQCIVFAFSGIITKTAASSQRDFVTIFS